MKVFKPLDISLLHKVFEWDLKQNLVITALVGFSLDDNESMLESDLWSFLSEALGKDQALDFCMPKHNGEVLVYGNYYSPTKNPVTADRVGFSLGAVSKELAVVGDRYWRPVIGPTPPESFTFMPVDYAHAFGGEGFDRNPTGKGVIEITLDTGDSVVPMPNIEDPDNMVTDKSQRPDPAGFGPIDVMWSQRSSKMGTYDEKWVNERAPAYPEDLDWTHFNIAPSDQWVDEYFTGNEQYEIANMHPEEPSIKGTLPGFRVQCFINMKTDENNVEDFRQIEMRAETVCLFPQDKKGVLIYRGTTNIKEDDASDVSDIVLGYEWLTSPEKGIGHYQQAMKNRKDEGTKLNYIMTTEDMIPEGVVCGFKRLLKGVDGPELAMMGNLQAKGDKVKAQMEGEIEMRKQQLIQQLEAAGIDPAPYLKKFDSKEEIDDPDIKRLMDFVDSIVPGASKGNRDVDVKDIDFSKMADLQKEMKIFAESQKKKIKDILEKEIEALSAQEETVQAAEEIRSALQKMDEAPALPRPEMDEAFINLKKNVEKSRQQYNDLIQQGISKEQLKALNIDIDIDAVEKQFSESSKKLKGVYRMGAHELVKGAPPHANRMDEKKEEFINLYQSGKRLHDGDFAGLDLSGMDISGIDLSLAYLEDVNLTNAKIDAANLSDSILSRAIFSCAEITNTDFSGANLGSSIASGARFSNCNFTGATLSKSNLEDAVFSNCDFTNVYLLEAKLSSVELSDCKLQKTIFLELGLDNSNLSRSDLSNCIFLNCTLEQSVFSEATMIETAFIGAKASRSNFSNANMTNVRFVMNCDLQGSKFTGSCLDKANLRGANLQDTDFTDTSISMADFSDAKLKNAVFNRAKGERPLFIKSDLALADLSNASFYEGSMLKARLTSANLKDANLYSVEFMGATVGGTDFSGANLDMSKLQDWRPEK